jgi:hypothetical protein
MDIYFQTLASINSWAHICKWRCHSYITSRSASTIQNSSTMVMGLQSGSSIKLYSTSSS